MRRMLRLAQRAGLQVVDLWPGAAVVTRDSDPATTISTLGLWPETTVVSRSPDPDAKVTKLGLWPETTVVSRSSDPDAKVTKLGLWPEATIVSRRPRPRVTPLDDQTTLVRRRGVGRATCDEWLVDTSGVTPITDAKTLIDLVANRDVMHVLELHRVNCVLDVGANIGQYALRLRESGWTGRIVSFEPVPHVFEELAAAAADDPDWLVRNVGLGREDAEATIHVDSGKGTMSSLLTASDYGAKWSRKLATTSPLTVQVRRLESMLPELLDGLDDPRVYLKLDTQGYDLEAFLGAGTGLDAVVAMQSEISSVPIYDGMPDLTTALDTYRSHGFDLAGCWPVSYERATHRALEFDAVMVRRPREASAPAP